MLDARDFFRAADDELSFDITIDKGENWFQDLGAIEIVHAIEHAMLYEETIKVDYFSSTILNELKMYVFLNVDRPAAIASLNETPIFVKDLKRFHELV